MSGAGRGCVRTRGRPPAVGANTSHILTSTAQVECGRHAAQENRNRVGGILARFSKIGVFTQPYIDTARFAKLILM
jgi:hypothetical protein